MPSPSLQSASCRSRHWRARPVTPSAKRCAGRTGSTKSFATRSVSIPPSRRPHRLPQDRSHPVAVLVRHRQRRACAFPFGRHPAQRPRPAHHEEAAELGRGTGYRRGHHARDVRRGRRDALEHTAGRLMLPHRKIGNTAPVSSNAPSNRFPIVASVALDHSEPRGRSKLKSANSRGSARKAIPERN
jgi:hypothetical protein